MEWLIYPYICWLPSDEAPVPKYPFYKSHKTFTPFPTNPLSCIQEDHQDFPRSPVESNPPPLTHPRYRDFSFRLCTVSAIKTANEIEAVPCIARSPPGEPCCLQNVAFRCPICIVHLGLGMLCNRSVQREIDGGKEKIESSMGFWYKLRAELWVIDGYY